MRDFPLGFLALYAGYSPFVPPDPCPVSPEAYVYGLHYPAFLLLWLLGQLSQCEAPVGDRGQGQRSGIYSPVSFLPDAIDKAVFFYQRPQLLKSVLATTSSLTCAGLS